MIRMFIYHWNPERVQKLREAVSGYFRRRKLHYVLTSCRDYQEADAYLKERGGEDDIFLFCGGNLQRTFHLAKRMRNGNLASSWIYADGSAEGLLRSLILRPSAFLPDSGDEERLFAVLDALVAFHSAMEKTRYFTFKCEGEYQRLPVDAILFLESSGKMLTLHQENRKNYYFRAKLDEIAASLPDSFLRCHQSFLVNLHVVRQLDEKNHVFILQNDDEIPVSRRLYPKAKRMYRLFMSEQN